MARRNDPMTSPLASGGLLNECRDFGKTETHNEHWMRGYATPTGEFPFRAQKADFRLHRKIKNLSRVATIEPLRHFQ